MVKVLRSTWKRIEKSLSSSEVYLYQNRSVTNDYVLGLEGYRTQAQRQGCHFRSYGSSIFSKFLTFLSHSDADLFKSPFRPDIILCLSEE